MLLNGLTLIENYINEEEEINLIDFINNEHYGYNYNKYKSSKINYIDELLNVYHKYISKILNDKYISEKPDKIIINRYLPGEGMSEHIDKPNIFKNKIYSLSLGSGCTMIFENKDNNEIKNIYIPPKTLLIMEDDARYKYTHSIESIKYDIINNNEIKRKTRYSITFRNMIL